VCELADKRLLDSRLASNLIPFGGDYASSNRAIIDSLPYRLEIVSETRVVRFETVWAVEAELAGVEVRVGLRLVFTRKLKFPGPCHAGYKFVTCWKQITALCGGETMKPRCLRFVGLARYRQPWPEFGFPCILEGGAARADRLRHLAG
jgi:hypothetical protein